MLWCGTVFMVPVLCGTGTGKARLGNGVVWYYSTGTIRGTAKFAERYFSRNDTFHGTVSDDTVWHSMVYHGMV